MPLAHLRCARRTEPVGRLESFVSLSLFIPPSIRDGGVAFSKRWICPFFFSFYSLLLGEGGCWFYSTSAQEPLGGSFEMSRARPTALLLRAGYTSPSSTRRVLGPRTTLETCLSILRSAPPVFLTYWEGKICLEPSLAVRAKGLIFSHNKATTPYFPRISARCNVTSPTTRRTWGLIVVFKTTLTTPMTSF